MASSNLGKPKSCPEHLELNPFTNRCNKKCTPDKERVTNVGKRNFKCYKICKPGSVRHEDTNRCRSLTKNSTRTRKTRKTKSPSLSEYFSMDNGEEEDLFFSGTSTPRTKVSYKVDNFKNSDDFDWWVNRSNGSSSRASQASQRSLDGSKKKADFEWWLNQNQMSDGSSLTSSPKKSQKSSVKGSHKSSVKGSLTSSPKKSQKSSVKGSLTSSVKGSLTSSVKSSLTSSVKGSHKSSVKKGSRSSSSGEEAIFIPRRYPQRIKPAPIDRFSPTFKVRKNKTKKKKKAKK
jgi:hypothetical protein